MHAVSKREKKKVNMGIGLKLGKTLTGILGDS